MRAIMSLFIAASLSIAAQSAVADIETHSLTQIIADRSEEDKSRDAARHPRQTLEFFQLEPGLTVAEALPGGGWYTKIIASYLSADGAIYGVNYADRMWPMFSFATKEFIDERIASARKFGSLVKELTDNGVEARGFTFSAVPSELSGTVDRFLMIRALHNLNRFEAQAGTRSQALAAVRALLKDDGMVGVVQHRAAESRPDDWADGSGGYLKESAVIAMFTDAGFELIAQSEVNANAKDQAGPGDTVWRLPPSFQGSDEGSEQRNVMSAIGESDRMTLLFRKQK
ncbi:MAG: putative methyltransferase [Halieaceae bacterium]|jgi:predicted methyltransferase